MVPGATLISDKPAKAQRYYATQPIRGCVGVGRGTVFQAAPIWPDVHLLFLELGSVDIWGYNLCFVYFLKVIYLVVLGLSCGMWGPLVEACGSSSLTRDRTSFHWELGVLTTGPPGKTLGIHS